MKKIVKIGLVVAALISNLQAVEKMEIKTKYETIEGQKKTMFLCGLSIKNLLAINLSTYKTEPLPFECLNQVLVFNNEILAFDLKQNVWFNTKIPWNEYVEYAEKMQSSNLISDGWTK
ncbi:MAG: hypothetical protein RBT22_00565 [Aliarcobacter sp.]|jgi:hypothetical protein|nr:hypothetical protein [Aliarcobacter sp.]